MVGSNAFGFEEVDGVRKHGIDALPRPRRRAAGSTSPACSRTRSASTTGATRSPTLATQDDTGAIKVAFDFRGAAWHDADDVVLVDIADRVAVITINRPEQRNALNRDVRRRCRPRSRGCDADDDVDVMILTGADPAFCAGVDLKEFGVGRRCSRARASPRWASVGDDGRTPFRGALPPHTKPLIGAVNGVAVTGGFEVALNCDFLIASDRARFADTHARVGVMPGWGLTVLLAQRIGVGAGQGDEHHRQLHRRADRAARGAS